MKKNDSNLQASLLDRLLDYEPRVPNEPVQFRLLTMRQIKTSVIRDLENLLNSRRNIYPLPTVFKETSNSIFSYGLQDFTAKNPKSPAVRQQLRHEIEKTISRFEPRLKNVTVDIEESDQKGHGLNFRIYGLLVIEPEREPVTFDTYFDANRCEYVILK